MSSSLKEDDFDNLESALGVSKHSYHELQQEEENDVVVAIIDNHSQHGMGRMNHQQAGEQKKLTLTFDTTSMRYLQMMPKYKSDEKEELGEPSTTIIPSPTTAKKEGASRRGSRDASR